MQKFPVALIAIILAAVGIGIYVITTTSGNNLQSTAANQAACAANETYSKALDATIGGEIAAVRMLDDPVDVSGLSFSDANGAPVTLSDWNGRVVLFNLWATWCAPCRAEMPALEELEASHGGDNFQVVPVSVDLGDAVKPMGFYEEINLKELPFFHEGEMKLFSTIKKQGLAIGMPVTLLVDQNSCARAVLNGPAEWASDDAVNFIKTAISLKGS